MDDETTSITLDFIVTLSTGTEPFEYNSPAVSSISEFVSISVGLLKSECNDKVLINACRALSSLVEHDSADHSAAEVLCASDVMTVMVGSPLDGFSDARRAVAIILRCLCETNVKLASCAVKHGMQFIVANLEKYQTSNELCLASCESLKSLIDRNHPSFRDAIFHSGAMRLVITIIKSNYQVCVRKSIPSYAVVRTLVTVVLNMCVTASKAHIQQLVMKLKGLDSIMSMFVDYKLQTFDDGIRLICEVLQSLAAMLEKFIPNLKEWNGIAGQALGEAGWTMVAKLRSCGTKQVEDLAKVLNREAMMARCN